MSAVTYRQTIEALFALTDFSWPADPADDGDLAAGRERALCTLDEARRAEARFDGWRNRPASTEDAF